MPKRGQRPGPVRLQRTAETKPVAPTERHSGEGSASALEILQKLEKRRTVGRTPDPDLDPEPPRD